MLIQNSKLPRNRNFRRAHVVSSTLLPISLLVCLVTLSGIAHAMKRIEITLIEWDTLPKLCRASQHTWDPPRGRVRPAMTEHEKKLMWSAGGWHYCHGLVKLRRAELMPRSDQMIAVANDAVRDINYSLNKIDPEEPWAAEMAVTRARAHRLLHERDEAYDYLAFARQHHPTYAPSYIALALLAFDEKHYAEAVEVLSEGNEATGGHVPELVYYLGLAHFYNGDIETAVVYEKEARSLGYPFDGLAKKIASYERSSAAQ